MHGVQGSSTKGDCCAVADSCAGAEIDDLARCCHDIEHLTRLAATWQGRDPTLIAESTLETLQQMLDLDVVGLRFDGSAHIFLRVGSAFAEAHRQQDILDGLETWLNSDPAFRPAKLSVGEDLSIHCTALGLGASIGSLVAASRRGDFPRRTERLRLHIAATQASLVRRELSELSERVAPIDMRAEKPTADALAESEWRLNLIINTIPAMAWSTTPEGLIDFGNQHFLDFVGGSFEEISGLNFYRIFHPDTLGPMMSAWQEIMATKTSRDIDGQIRRADGEYRWCTLRQKPLLDPEGNVVKWYGVVLDIEDRKRAENDLEDAKTALAASEQNLRLIIDSLPVLAWVCRPDGGADFVNQSWADYAGVDAEKILEWGFLNFYHPDDADRMERVWRDCLATKDRIELKGRIRRFDGEYRWFYFAGQKITDAHGVVRWVGANVDFEDLQRAEDALKSSERRLELTIDTIPALSWSADTDGKVDFWSKNLLDFCGLQFEDVMDDGFYRIFHPDDLEAMRCNWERVRAQKHGEEIDGRVLRSDGQYRWFNLRQSPLLDDNGDVVKWYGALIEIEDRKHAEDELRQSQSELARVTRMTTLGELAVSIAHEINQPLMGVVANAGTCLRWLEEGHHDVAKARQAAERIVRDGHRAGDIIASIRSLAQKSLPTLLPMDLREPIRVVLELLKGELQGREIALRLDFPNDDLMVIGDRTQMQQVILNLIMNGAEAMTEVENERRRLTIRCFDNGQGFAEVTVEDCGTGLTAEIIDRIFDPFFSTKPTGMGMGLPICRSIVEAHGGQISASANSASGSMILFTAPLVTEAGEQ